MPLLLAVAFLTVPLAEIALIIATGRQIGAGATVLLLLAISVAGAWLVKREGLRAWGSLRGAVTAGRLPDRELADAALVLIGGTLLLTPGFLTDAVGLLLVVPVTRPPARRLLSAWVARRAQVRAAHWGGPGGPGGPAAGWPGPGGRPPGASGTGDSGTGGGTGDGRVVPGEVVEPPEDPDGDGQGPAGPGSPRG